VERETKRDYGSGYNKSHKPGYGSNRIGPKGSNKNDWVFVNNKESGSGCGSKSNGVGPKAERQAQYDKRRHTPRDRGYTQLSYNELMERKQKGLCFKCGGAFHPMHQCPDKQLRVLIVDDEEEGEQGGKLLAVEVEDEDEEAQGEMSMLEFQQFHQLDHLGRSKPQVIKLKGTIHEVPVVILVDSGASHNFISQHLVHKMNWDTIDSPPMSIKLGDGSCAKTKGICQGLEIDMEGLKVVVDVQLFDLGCVDVVLGIEWLRTLGDMIVNWQKHSMSFWFNKEWVTLRGMENQFGMMETLHSVLCKPLWSGLEGWGGKKKKEGQSRSLEHLLNLCADVFQEPKGLPPKRTKEHVITLKEGEGAVNVRPYRYPHHHKNEIEKQTTLGECALIIVH
ncbi:RNA-directed DNA polymerase (Reverse transcriptase), partial [Trifolium medium]|nr:RNA-directed DNA polymerase (Reverse transcriptase) [Trifolium medium]